MREHGQQRQWEEPNGVVGKTSFACLPDRFGLPGGFRCAAPPKTEAGRLWVHQLQLTVADFVLEIHDTHHPLSPSLY